MTPAERIARTERENAVLRAEIDKLEAEMWAMRGTLKQIKTSQSGEERDALAAAQARADSVMAMHGERAPAPIPGETALAYRKRLLTKLQKHSPAFANTSFAAADDALLSAAEAQIFNDAQTAARNTASAPGKLVEVRERDYAGRHVVRSFGDPMSWMKTFMAGGQRGRINRSTGGGNV